MALKGELEPSEIGPGLWDVRAEEAHLLPDVFNAVADGLNER